MTKTKDETCAWKANDDGAYRTRCGHIFEFTCDGVRDNRFVYCPYCGKTIKEIKD
jgi:hypothetical protein